MSIADFLTELSADDSQRKNSSGPAPVVSLGGGAAGGGLPDPALSPVEAPLSPPGVADEQATPPPPPKPVTWGSRLAGLLGGALRSPFTAGAAVADLESDTFHKAPAALLAMPGLLPSAVLSAYAFNGHAAQFERSSPLAKIGEPGWNETAAQVLSYAIGGTGVEVGVGRGVRALAQGLENGALRFLATSGTTAGEAAITSGAMIDPEQERFSNYMGELGLHSAFTDYLSHTDEESRAEGRFKNAVEGAVTGVAADQLFKVGRYWYKALKGDTGAADAIAGEIEEAAPKDAPQPKIEEVPAAEAGGDRRGAETKPKPDGTLVWEPGEDGTLNAKVVPKEEASGAAGEPPKAVTGDASDAEASIPPSPDQPPDAVVFRLTPGEGEAPRDVGSTTPQDLKALGEDVSIWRATAEFAGRDATNVTLDTSPEAAARVGDFHLSPLGGPDNVAPLLRAFIDRLPDTAKRTDGDLMKAALAVSRDIGEDPNSLVEAGRMIAGKLTDADVAMATLRSIWVRAAKDIDELNLPGVDWESVPDEAFAKAAQAVHNMTTLSTYVQTAKTALGRGLRVNQLPDAGTYLGTLAKAGEEPAPMAPRQMSPLPRSRGELKDWMDLWNSTKGDPATRAKFLENLLTVPSPGMYLRTSFANQFTANILSGPKTLLIHVIGPSLLNTVRAVERLSGAAAMSLNPMLSAEERALGREVAKATVPAYFQNLTDIGSSLDQAWKSSQLGESTLGGGTSYFDTPARTGPLTDNLLRASGVQPDWRYTLGNYINVWPRTLSRVLTGLNEFSKRVVYQGDVRVNAMVEASQKGLTGDEAHAFIANKMATATDEAGEGHGRATPQGRRADHPHRLPGGRGIVAPLDFPGDDTATAGHPGVALLGARLQRPRERPLGHPLAPPHRVHAGLREVVPRDRLGPPWGYGPGCPGGGPWEDLDRGSDAHSRGAPQSGGDAYRGRATGPHRPQGVAHGTSALLDPHRGQVGEL
jgi:hypothetical protein